MTNEEKLESLYQLRTAMQTLDDKNTPQDKKACAFENLFDAYIKLKAKPSHITPLKEYLIDQISAPADFDNLQDTAQRLAQLQKILPLKGLTQNNSLNSSSLSDSIKILAQGTEIAKQLSEQLTQLQEQKILVDQNGINDLLKKASKITNKEKSATKEKASTDKAHAKAKLFLETAFAKKQGVAVDSVNLTKVELREENGKKEIVMTDGKKQSVSYRINIYKGKEILGGDFNSAKETKGLLTLLAENNPLSFGKQQPQPAQKKSKDYSAQDFFKELNIKLTKTQAPDLSKELKGYNALLSQDAKSAEELKQKLHEKYTALTQEEQKQTISDKLTQTTQKLGLAAEKANKMWKQAFSKIPEETLLDLSAPAAGQNKDMAETRKQFSEFIKLMCPPNTLSQARNKTLYSLQNDDILWKELNQTYYKQIKECAQDNSFQASAQQMFAGNKTPQEALKDNLAYLSPDVAKLVLARSVITYGMGNYNRNPEPEKTNKILDKFGFQVSLTPIPVEVARETTSAEMTLVMRCLADGHPLDVEKLNKDISTRLEKESHQKELKQAFGKEENYELLVENVLKHKDSQNKTEQTPYQTHNMKIGLLAALSPEMSEQIDFSEELRRSQPLEDQKQWDLDDYLFTRYMNLYFKKEISPANKESIKKLKNCYDWQGFKKQHTQTSQNIYDDFTIMSKNTKTIVRNALTEGKLNECSQHHQKPVKYAVFSSDPSQYNNTLVTAVQIKPWQEDLHQLHHLATIEGTDMIPPYCVKTPEGYTRRSQKDIKEGSEVYFESLQRKDKDGKYRDLIPANSFYLSISCGAVPEPQPTQKALDFYRQKSTGKALEI